MRYEGTDYEAEFERRWLRWPEAGRSKRYTCERLWAFLFHDIGERAPKLAAEIDAGITRWLGSQQFADGYVFGFDKLLDPLEMRWKEKPKPSRRAVPAEDPPAVPTEAPPLECGCGEAGCAICKVLATRAG